MPPAQNTQLNSPDFQIEPTERACTSVKEVVSPQVTTLAIFKEQSLAEKGRGHLYYSAPGSQCECLKC